MSATKTNTNLSFPNNDAGEEQGLGDAGIETFRDAPFPSVARECGQNSADARVKSPVEVRFDVFEIATSDYPPRAAQRRAVESCLAKAREAKEEKAIDFFTRALEVLGTDSLKILRIADANTRGLIGPAMPGTPFHSLVKSTGISNKESETSGGSFGIGKNAAFATSELQTVFYSTVYLDEKTGVEQFLAQGKTILTSHVGDDGKERRATGYWGLPGFAPVSDPAQVPDWLRREGVGTSVFVVGMRDLEGWQSRIAASLLQNFFPAIHDGKLRFLIDGGKVDINAVTLPSLFQASEIIRAAKASDQSEDFEFAESLFRCLVSESSYREELFVEGLGRIRCTILMEEGLPRRVMIVRNGMEITGTLEHFGDKFNRFPMYREFVALVEPLDDVGSALIKRLENPRHDSLSAERLTDKRKRGQAAATMKCLAKAIREAIKKHALPEPEDQVTLEELASFFADTEPSDKPPQPSAEENPETVTYTPAPVRKRKPEARATLLKGEAGGAGGAGGTAGGGNGGRGKGQGDGTGGTGNRGGSESVPLDDFRNVLPVPNSRRTRRLFFTPGKTCFGTLIVQASGLDSPARLEIVAATLGEAKQGALTMALKSGERVSVDVELADDYDGPLELIASGQGSEV
jgi:hypothetical protein